MSENSSKTNRIPFEKLADSDAVESWQLPSVEKKEKVVFGAKRDKASVETRKDNETIENYSGSVNSKTLTASQLQEIAKEAKKEGYDLGYQEGHEKGLEEGIAKVKKGFDEAYKDASENIESEISRLKNISSALMSPMREQGLALENIIVEMAINFAKKIIAQELEISPDIILNNIEATLSTLPAGSSYIDVYLNKDDADLLDKSLPVEHRDWQVKIDDSLARGGCRVETNESIVDYSCEERMNKFLHQVNENGEY